MEIVGEEGDNYLVRNLPPDDPQSAAHSTWWRNEANEIFAGMKKDYFTDKYLIVNNPDVPPPFTDQLRFVAADAGLPRGGRWQMSFDVADMNGDGLPDLVFGPQRTGPPTPYIFLQQKDGSWKLWQDARWPTQGLKLDYGTVRVADFDRDGNKDIAIACHFSRTYVLYGDGKGDFTRFVTVPQSNQDMTSRALAVADFDGDGRPDIATFAEMDLNMASARPLQLRARQHCSQHSLRLAGGHEEGVPRGDSGRLADRSRHRGKRQHRPAAHIPRSERHGPGLSQRGERPELGAHREPADADQRLRVRQRRRAARPLPAARPA